MFRSVLPSIRDGCIATVTVPFRIIRKRNQFLAPGVQQKGKKNSLALCHGMPLTMHLALFLMPLISSGKLAMAVASAAAVAGAPPTVFELMTLDTDRPPSTFLHADQEANSQADQPITIAVPKQKKCGTGQQTVVHMKQPVPIILSLAFLCHGPQSQSPTSYTLPAPQGNLKIALQGGGGDMDARRRRGGVGERGFRVGPFVLCKNGCWRQRPTNTKFGPKKFFPPIIPPPPHLSSQIDQRDVGIILSHGCWVDPPPPRHGRSGTPALNSPLPSRRPRREGGGVGKMGFRVTPPPQSNFLPAQAWVGMECNCRAHAKSRPRDTPPSLCQLEKKNFARRSWRAFAQKFARSANAQC